MSNELIGNSSTKTEKSNTAQLIKVPKNIRQIGQPSQSEKIYIEDYVVTYMRKYSENMKKGKSVIVLLGQSTKIDDCDYLFIDGAVETGYDYYEEVSDKKYSEELDEKINKYFPERSIVGWGVICVEWNLEDEDVVKKHCEKYKDKDVFLVYDVLEREETFYFIRFNKIIKQKGYFVYYERNEKMQNYMLDFKGNQSIEYGYSEEVITKIRNVVADRDIKISDGYKNKTDSLGSRQSFTNKSSSNKNAVFSSNDLLKKNSSSQNETKKFNIKYAAVMLLIIAVLGMSVGKIGTIEQITKEKAGIVVSKAEKLKTKGNDSDSNSKDNLLDIETISGNIEKKSENNNKNDNDILEDNDNNNKGNSVNNTNKPKSTAKPSATPKPTKKATTTPKPTKKATATPKPTKKATATPKPVAENKETSKKSEIIYYKVVKGDSLESISKKMYGNTSGVSKLLKANNLDDEDIIYEGEKLIIPQ